MYVQLEALTGDLAFAYGALAANVRFVSGYPGSPSSGTFEALLNMPEAQKMQLVWAINECIALEMAFGAAIAGQRALLCVKSVGMNVALDPLMTMVLTGPNGGFVILLGDDPGGWASQNEQDSRILAVLADVPLLEPADPQEAYDMLPYAFDLSEAYNLPVIVRETRALALSQGPVALRELSPHSPRQYQREPNRWISLPEGVVRRHRALHHKLGAVAKTFETSPWNHIEGEGRLGLVACGAAYPKLRGAFEANVPPEFTLLKLGTFYPFPEKLVAQFLSRVDSVLVLEENEPYVERWLAACAHDAGRQVPIAGRLNGLLPFGGELDTASIGAALQKYGPERDRDFIPLVESKARAMPSQSPLCLDCPYTPLFEALLDSIEEIGGRDHAVIVGEPGCMVRAQLPPMELLDVKYSLGSSLGLAVGLAIALSGQKVISLTGDSSFLHHGWGGLVEAVRSCVDLVVIILDNGAAALTGGQPHAGTPYNARRMIVPALDVARIAELAGVARVQVVDPWDRAEAYALIRSSLAMSGVRVIVARRPCPRLNPRVVTESISVA